MDDQGYTFVCPRCGNEVKSKSRYCMKCGYLNPDHPSNQDYLEQFEQDIPEEYIVSNGGELSAPAVHKKTNGVDVRLSGNTGSFKLCFLVNFLIYFLLVLVIVYSFYSQFSGDITSIIKSNMCNVLLLVSIFFIIEYSVQLTYMKMNKRWWLSLIPLVNLYHLSDAVSESKIQNILIFIPVIGEIYLLVVLYKIGKAFKKSGFFTMLFPFILFPIIGFDGSCFQEVCYISNKDSLEKEYGKKRVFFSFALLIILASVGMIAYKSIVHVPGKMSLVDQYYLYYASKIIIKGTQSKVEKKAYYCDAEEDVMYFYFQNVDDDIHIPFSVYRDPIESYVKVVKVGTQYYYFISITDSHYGYAEISSNKLEVDNITEYKDLDTHYKDGNQCILQ